MGIRESGAPKIRFCARQRRGLARRLRRPGTRGRPSRRLWGSSPAGQHCEIPSLSPWRAVAWNAGSTPSPDLDT